MNDPVIEALGICKTYPLYNRPIDRLFEAIFPWCCRHRNFHALTDVAFSLARGEHLGIIGMNGAGKSTLLQILTGVLTPSSGSLRVEGRLAALLELGSGLNPELTGRQNVAFMAPLLDIPQERIEEVTERIIDFASIGDFMDQPVKTYSSGMFVRLAFAIAVVAEPDILIVDEALAVGDVRFQKKCLDHMQAMKERGVTIILVTHDIFTAKTFCTRLLLLHQGRIVADGNPELVATEYYRILFPTTRTDPARDSLADSEEGVADPDSPAKTPARTRSDEFVYTVKPEEATGLWGKGGAWLEEMRLYDLLPPNRFTSGQTLVVECDYRFDPETLCALARESHLPLNLAIGLRLDTARGIALCDLASASLGNGRLDFDIERERRATFRFECILPHLARGSYFLTPGVAVGIGHTVVPACGYDNLVALECETGELVFGILKPVFSIERVR